MTAALQGCYLDVDVFARAEERLDYYLWEALEGCYLDVGVFARAEEKLDEYLWPHMQVQDWDSASRSEVTQAQHVYYSYSNLLKRKVCIRDV